MSAWQKTMTIYRRELKSYFQSPIAYVCIVIFLLVAQALAFLFGGLIERGEASLTDSFFTFLPWIFMIVAPAVGMRLWSEEQRQGTMELILTMPIAPWQAILGKFLAAAVVLLVAIALTFPVVLTINYLGDPDNGAILCGYLGSYFLALSCLAVTSVVSAFTRNQVVCLLVSVSICLFIVMAGFPPVTRFLGNLPGGASLVDVVASFSVMSHFIESTKGVLVSRDVVFFLSFIFFCLFSTAVVLRMKRA
ncbi:MAG: ABC transporter permease [Verrucomicrobiales bacterium]